MTTDKCIKCGGGNHTLEFVPEEFNRVEYKTGARHYASKEYLLCTCDTCGYQYKKDTLDGEKK